jgi:hypothetical protein
MDTPQSTAIAKTGSGQPPNLAPTKKPLDELAIELAERKPELAQFAKELVIAAGDRDIAAGTRDIRRSGLIIGGGMSFMALAGTFALALQNGSIPVVLGLLTLSAVCSACTLVLASDQPVTTDGVEKVLNGMKGVVTALNPASAKKSEEDSSTSKSGDQQ